VLALAAVVWYPVKRLLGRGKRAAAAEADQAQADGKDA
jgi:hypothetical protein